MRSFALLLLVLFLACLVAACGTTDLVILHLNDFHGQVQPKSIVTRPGRPAEAMGGVAAIEDFVRQERRKHDLVWVTDGGDWFQGTPEGNEDRGLSIMACANRRDLTAAVVGNHEYDFGEENLIQIAATAEHPVLGANIFTAGTQALRPYVKPYLIRNVGGVRVAVVGLITSDTKNVSTGPFGQAEFRDEVAVLRKLWPELKRRADAILLLTHCGLQTDVRLARAFPEVVLILGGHSHTELWRGHQEGDTWIVQGGSRGTAMTRVRLSVGTRHSRLRVLGAELVRLPARAARPGTDTAAFLARRFAHIGPRWDTALGRIGGAPDRRTGPGSTAAGNLIAELIRTAGRAQVGLMNKGGIRAVLRAGPITRRQVFELLPFDNSVATFALTGAQLRQALQLGLRPGRQPLEIAGGRYTYRVVDGRRELLEVWVGASALVPDTTYRVATNSFVARGGDGFRIFGELEPVDTDPAYLRDLLVTALRRQPEVRLSAEQRIGVVQARETAH
ncbi:MAG: bifunctional metallophosphatase/5'-nucleotidase [Planctomycetota bacterium]|jgi:2',3'-cyclic-nucleotide 2'-phosphodiesterase (5'-nucleotidase family)